ncbi:MAG: TIGR03086 family metal-binding protein, partial [Ilumatobacteraceae bacterium]|nr:TIGR03086 family metal-binding protein [Ilumatobacteraceae bacterium]
MSIQPLEQAVAAARSVLVNVGRDDLGRPSPCASWDVAGLINHLIGAQHYFAAAARGEAPTGEAPDFAAGDYVAAFDEVSTQTLQEFSQAGFAERTVQMPFGPMPGAAVAGLAATDTVTHAWDLAKATGQSTDLAPELAEQLLASSRMMIQPAFRGPDGAAP